MGKLKRWWQGHRPTQRRLVQLYAALLYNANLRGFADGEIYRGPLKALCVPGLNCYSCPGAVGACPLGALQNALNAAGHRAPWYVLGVLMLFGLSLGRTICGWLCPMGLLQELLHRVPTPKLRKGPVTRALSWVKYAVLAALVVAVPLWAGLARGQTLPAFCKTLCPAGTFEGAVGLLANPANDGLFASLGALFTRKFVILTAVALACVFCHRAFCRFLCPLGALYGLFNRAALVGMRVDAGRCNGCGTCAHRCPMDVRRVGDRECIACGRCVGHCPKGAIALRAGGMTLVGPREEAPRTGRRPRLAGIAWGVALALLAVALVGVNLSRPSAGAGLEPVPEREEAGDAPIGWKVGERLADFETPLIGGGEFRLSDYRGRVVFINLWATYCKPCVGELPLFEQLTRDHPDVEVLAIHSGLTTEDVAEYLAEKGWELDFALDGEDGALFALVNGSTKLPQTVALNGRGEVVYNEVRSVTGEMLEALYRRAAES